jgi:hypothetical protein
VITNYWKFLIEKIQLHKRYNSFPGDWDVEKSKRLVQEMKSENKLEVIKERKKGEKERRERERERERERMVVEKSKRLVQEMKGRERKKEREKENETKKERHQKVLKMREKILDTT